MPRRAARTRAGAGASALDERDFATEATDRLRHLDADRPSAEHEHPARHGLHPGHLPVRPDPLKLAQARDRRDYRIRAGRQDDMVGGAADAVHLDDTGASQTASATKQVDAVVSKPALLAGIGVVRDHEVPPRKRSVDVDLRR